MNKYLKSGLVLSVICIILALVLAGVNAVTAPIIEENDKKATQAALFEVYPDADSFEPVDLKSYENIPVTVTEAYRANDGGYVVKLNTTGYKSDMIVIFGISPSGEVVGAECLSSNETLSAEKTYGERLIGKNLDTVDSVDAVAGATKTSDAYKNAAKDAIGASIIFGGGSYDNRTEDEIKLDEALPSAEGAFENVFVAEYIEDLNQLYKATNGTGYVFVFGDAHVGVDNSGAVVNVVTGLDEEGNAITDPESKYTSGIADALASVLGTASEAVDITAYSGISSYIQSVEKTVSGNYIVVVTARGYDAQSEYSPTKMPIKIKVSVTADGKIISVLTLEQNETSGVGDICADPDYYTQYNGKDSESYKNVDIVAGATKTTTAYKDAIGKVFAAISIIESAENGK